MTQKRQPKGTETGGQFAASANPESTLDLANENSEATREGRIVALSTCARAVDEMLDWYERFKLGMVNDLDEQMRVLSDAREEVLLNAYQPRAGSWRSLEQQIRHTESEGIDDPNLDMLRDEREEVYFKIVREALNK